MIKLGFYTEEKETSLKKQGEFLAANQFKEELHFIFREEATLPNLSGSHYGVLRKKKAFFLSQLRKVNHGLSPNDIERIKENTYREMYGLMKEELLQLKEMAEVHKHISISRKIKHLTAVIDRIKSEIQVHDFKDTIKNLTAPVQQQTINEGA
jgi:phosphopantetheinyl transferase (holo-ACP synthase)